MVQNHGKRVKGPDRRHAYKWLALEAAKG